MGALTRPTLYAYRKSSLQVFPLCVVVPREMPRNTMIDVRCNPAANRTSKDQMARFGHSF